MTKTRGRIATTEELEVLIALLRENPPFIGAEATIHMYERASGDVSAFYHRGWDEFTHDTIPAKDKTTGDAS
jgi:hypothetical protein